MGVNVTVATAPPGYMSVAEAAAEIDAKPWDVVRLIEAGELDGVTLVDAESLRQYQEKVS